MSIVNSARDRSALQSISMSAMGCDLKGSLQPLNSHYRDGGVENEVSNKDLLHRSR